ncbi:MAG TPA: sigma-54 dependent transcriptional regulator [Candidatus Eremiobacteraeota bacterium]|nr:MAG: Transcriptional regulatory protein ZraR [bacterium ADurb.Bin363]HPZ10019.1 sigma-54 dependent transcriptional regulator [Candidatus Eremiobacteraeota bacterium]
MKEVILVIDDEDTQREILTGFLKKLGYKVEKASSGKEGLSIIANKAVDLVLTDFKMADIDGIEVLESIKKLNPEIGVIIITAFGTIEKSVEAMRKGAEDYLIKPINLDELELIIKKALERKSLISENVQLKKEISEKYHFSQIVYSSKVMEEVMNLAARVAPTKASVLIRGESGTGKELVAKAIHYGSPRKNKTLIIVNCGVLNENLLISTLFGHEKGSFTGAIRQTRGKFELSDKGTIFIDEVGDLPLAAQIQLLRVLQEGNFERLGGESPVEVDVRVIAATHRPVEQMIAIGTFREDLFYRLNVITITIPPLRERKEDIPALLDHYLKIYAEENSKKIINFSKEAFDLLMKYDYPGNVRELKNIVERAVILSRGELITSEDLTENIKRKEKRKPTTLYGTLPQQIETLERALIQDALKQSEGVQTRAAEILGISERNLRYKIQKLGLK